MKRTLIIAAVLLSTVVFALPAIAGPDRHQTATNGSNSSSENQVHGPAAAQAGTVSRDLLEILFILGDPAWTFNWASAVLKITDAFSRAILTMYTIRQHYI